VPRICFINKMDRVGADFWRAANMIKERLGARPIVVQLPIGKESGFRGVIDLIEAKAIVWADDLGTEMECQDIPAELKAEVEEARAKMVEAIAETSDES